ncbi:MAG: methionyl-tRNA formyltransferase, partial [Clostridia bacterium]|nr:methionyl-tRNA formyltransferase [Clostridia bacterium]
MKIKAVFAGTPAFALPSLCALHELGIVAAVLTQPDKPQGRKGILTPSPVKAEAEKLGIPVLQPAKLKEDFSALKEVGADIMVTCAYGQLLTQDVLDLFPKGVWNVHASLLPAYRGAAPIARALMDGQTQTGVTIMKTELGLDTGDMLLSDPLPILKEDTAGTLTDKLSVLGAELIVKAVGLLESGNFRLTKQG